MNDFLLAFSWLAPLLAAPLSLHRRGAWLVPLAALPALLTAVTVPLGTHTEVSWLLLGAHFGLDASTRVFLLFTALLWLLAGLQAVLTMRGDPHWVRFQVFFLLTMAGNLWLIVGQDMVNFFLGFALMGLAAYGMVIHRGDTFSLRAGRVYLAMTLAAEVILFAALLFIFRHTETLLPQPAQLVGLSHWAIGLLVVGLGIKAALILLHTWLPLAYSAAPVPASAVLSGAMSKAVLIGWMRFLPQLHSASWPRGRKRIQPISAALLVAPLKIATAEIGAAEYANGSQVCKGNRAALIPSPTTSRPIAQWLNPTSCVGCGNSVSV